VRARRHRNAAVDVALDAVEQALLDRLHLKLGDTFLIGEAKFIARAVLVSEPDRLGRCSRRLVRWRERPRPEDEPQERLRSRCRSLDR
jgi:hypothetical protein